MLNRGIEQDLKQKTKLTGFVTPDYEEFSFSNIPTTILNNFSIKSKGKLLSPLLFEEKLEGSEKIVLILLDGFGYHQWLKYYQTWDFFNSFTQKGIVSPITSVFPSTTAAALTTFNTGLTPSEHSVLEWHLYLKEIDKIIETIPFRVLGDDERDSLLEQGVEPEILYNGTTIYQTLSENDVSSSLFIKSELAQTVYQQLFFKGSEILAFQNYTDLFSKLNKELEKENSPAYYIVYISEIDSAAHDFGLHSYEYFTQLATITSALTTEFVDKIEKKTAKKATIIITADHGIINIPPNETLYLNHFRSLMKNLRDSEKMGKIAPTGSSRDIFIHLNPDKIEETINHLSEILNEKAVILKTRDAVEMGLFGSGKVGIDFFDRAGDLLILPFSNVLIWYKHIEEKRFEHQGHHGGLDQREVLVPFAVAKLSDIL